jgi:4-aminobutyrate aminotransferase / (S)-3-amino-2-methylpropionate transaminase / 5-aminovalerate transaminase
VAHQSNSDENLNQEQLLAKDAKYVLRPWPKKNEPVPIVKASGCVVTDADGNDFIDFTSGYFVNNAGHSHPRVIDAAVKQLHEVSQVSGRHTTVPLVNLAEKLVQITPKSVDKAFFTTGGSESTEFALKLARQHTGKTDIACVDNGFHGLSLGALAACGAEKYRATAGVPLGDYVYRVPTPYCYRCSHQKDCATQCLDEAEKQLDARPNTAAFLAEPVQSVGGIRPPEAWWQRADEIRKRRGLLLILDEIQTGIGRTGRMYAAEHYGLEPDLLTTAKGLSGGVGSLGAVVLRAEVGQGFFAGTTPTSGGNAVSAAAGLALIDVLLEEKIIENCAKMGVYFTGAVADLDDPYVGDIRFTGLLGGVELVLDRDSKEPLPKDIISEVQDSLHEQGMLITVSGPLGNVLRLQPPLTITTAEADQFIAALRVALARGRELAASH